MRATPLLIAILLALPAHSADPDRHVVRAGKQSANPPSYERHVVRAPDPASRTEPQRITTPPNLQPLQPNPYARFVEKPHAPAPLRDTAPVLNPDMSLNITAVRVADDLVWDYATNRYHFVERLADGRTRIRED